MAAEDARSRLLVVGLLLAVVGIAATGLAVAFRDEPASIEARDAARGQRLRATFVLTVEDEPIADAVAMLTLTNRGERPAFYAPVACSGPSEPVVAPEGARAAGAIDTRLSLRERLLAAGASARAVTMYPDADLGCEADGPVAVEPGETVSVEYVAAEDLDRAAALQAVAVVREVTRTGRALGRLRLVVPIESTGGDDVASIDQAVDAFLADPQVADFVAAAGDEGMLTQVTREEGGWRFGLSASGGDLSAEVLDGVAVTAVTISA